MKTHKIKNKTAGETRVLRDHIYLLSSCGAWRKEAVTVAEFALWKKIHVNDSYLAKSYKIIKVSFDNKQENNLLKPNPLAHALQSDPVLGKSSAKPGDYS